MNILNLEESSAVLYRKIKEKGRLSIRKLSSAELLDAIKLDNEGYITLDRTRKGNVSRFLIIAKEV